jgi:hypothetical protein
MPDFRSSDVAVGLVSAFFCIAFGCRSEGRAPDGSGAPGASHVTSAPVSSLRADAHSAALPASPASVGTPAPSAFASAGATDCGEAKPPSAPLPQVDQQKLTSERHGFYRFELQYPVFPDSTHKGHFALNRLLSQKLTTLQKRFLDGAGGEGRAPDPDNARWFEGKCELAYASRVFVSVACDTMEGPGAHPNLDKFAYNYRVCPDVREVTLSDLCRSLADCRRRIVQLINDDFRSGEKKQTGIQFREDTKGTAGDTEQPVAKLDAFGITPSGLRVFLFDELPHVLQAFAIVDIPAAKLRSVVRDDVARQIWGG